MASQRKRVIQVRRRRGDDIRYSDELAPSIWGCCFRRRKLDHILGQVAADAGRAQLRTAETEKYPHVTYFLNGGQETTFPGEDRIMVPSPKAAATYDLQPGNVQPPNSPTAKVVAAIDVQEKLTI